MLVGIELNISQDSRLNTSLFPRLASTILLSVLSSMAWVSFSSLEMYDLDVPAF